MNFLNSICSYAINSTISSNTFVNLIGITFYNSAYYTVDWSSGNVVMFDKNWTYIKSSIYISPYLYKIIAVNGYLYVTTYQNGIYKIDLNLNIIGNYLDNYFEGMYYNSTSNTIFVASYYSSKIVELTPDLVFVSSMAAIGYPSSLNGFNNTLYVGTIQGNIVIYVDRIFSYLSNGCSNVRSSSALTILFDDYGNMGVQCEYLYEHYFLGFYLNGSYTGYSMSISANFSEASQVFFDSSGSLLLVGTQQIILLS